ncbi:MAG: hypothetical protein MJZ40_03090 [Bacteroidaceae bacterium]|nr:hypothetical protein [Bacteroidaceae bacterium]
MKKILLLAAALVLSVGAWAQGTLELQPSTENVWEHQYRLHARNENGNYWLTSGLHSGNEAAAGKFAFVEQGTTGNYYVYSVDEGKWLTYSNTSTGANKITLSATKDAYFVIESGTCTNGSAWGDKKGYVLKASSANVYMNFFQGPTTNNYQTTGTIGFWSDKWGDAGSVWVLESAGASTSPFDATKEYVLKNVADKRGYIAYNPAGGNYVGLADVTYSDALAAKHAQSSNPAVGINWVVTTTSEGKVTLYNSKKGQYMTVRNDGKCVWSDDPYEFVYELGEGYVAFKGNGNPSGGYLCPAPGYNANQGPVLLETSSTIKNEYKFYFEEVTEAQDGYTLHVGATGYASMYLDKNVTIPEGVKVFYCPEEWEDYVLKTVEISKDQVLPYYTAYIIEAPANQDYFFPYTEAKGGDFVNVEGLWGCASKAMSRQELEDVCFSEWGMNITNFYVLSVVDGKAGFYRYIGEEFALNKAFYFHPTSLANETQGFVLDFGGQTTGVDNVTTTTQSAASYDLQGRRVSKATRGLFIQNGVKVIR